VAFDPKGDGKTVIRASFECSLITRCWASTFSAMLPMASRAASCCSSEPRRAAPAHRHQPAQYQRHQSLPGHPCNSDCLPPGLAGALGYQATSPQSSLATARRTSSASIRVFPNSPFLNQGYLSPATGFPLIQQPFGYPQAKNFV